MTGEDSRISCIPWASTECLKMEPDSGINANSMRGGGGLNAVERVDGAMGEDVKEDSDIDFGLDNGLDE